MIHVSTIHASVIQSLVTQVSINPTGQTQRVNTTQWVNATQWVTVTTVTGIIGDVSQ